MAAVDTAVQDRAFVAECVMCDKQIDDPAHALTSGWTDTVPNDCPEESGTTATHLAVCPDCAEHSVACAA